MIVAGFGFRAAADVAGLRAALVKTGAQVTDFATALEKADAPALRALALEWAVPLHGVRREVLAAQGVAGSERVQDLFGTGSVAEAAALAVAGRGARLTVGRMTSDDGMVVVAIAEGDGA
jgi:cobalt-precorrin 5A hydrolase